jgi:diguanylate cyclase (GGDEF)-like protein
MPRFLTTASAAETIDAIGEAIDLLECGIAVLDAECRPLLINRRLAALLPATLATPTLRDLLNGAVGSLDHARAKGGPPGDLAAELDALEAAVRASAIPATGIAFGDGRKLRLCCTPRRDGGAVLTFTDMTPADGAANPHQQAQNVAEQMAVELRFNNETLESQAAYLASLAETADANAQAAEDAKRLLEQEIAGRRELEERLRRMATIDTLTGVLNRGQLLALGQREVERVQKQGAGMAVLMLDIDHFKTINDRYGHPAGDKALQHLVSVLRTGVRRIDLLGRLGGEEFAIVLPAITDDVAMKVAERLRAMVAGSLVWVGPTQIGMTVSIGVALLGEADRTVEQLLARADVALYAAKNAGRDRVVCETDAAAAA